MNRQTAFALATLRCQPHREQGMRGIRGGRLCVCVCDESTFVALLLMVSAGQRTKVGDCLNRQVQYCLPVFCGSREGWKLGIIQIVAALL